MANIRKGLFAGAAVCAVAVSTCSLPAYAATFAAFDPPDSIATYPTAINGGAITGYYYDKYYGVYGFLRAADNSITSFGVQGASETIATSINEGGTITGWYGIGSAIAHGFAPYDVCTSSGSECAFVRTADGTITVFTPDGSIGTQAISINASGWITGNFFDIYFDCHGFVRTSDGTITTFDPAGSTLAQAMSINQSGMIAGYYTDSDDVNHGFMRRVNGSITTFDPPLSTSTFAERIDNAGTVTGYYLDSADAAHGFARTADGKITTFDPYGSTITHAIDIARSGTIAGNYWDSSSVSHGFVRKPAGRIISFDSPGASQTFPTGIDSARTDRNAITGWYEDSSGIYHGFLRTP